MTPEHIESNIKSWKEISKFIEGFSDPDWSEWQILAKQTIQYGLDRSFDRHFRAGQSLHTLGFSTLDHYGINYEPNVWVTLTPPDSIKVEYLPAVPTPKGDKKLRYVLEIEDGLKTFHRFLNHLWEMTRPEPLPSEMRSHFVAPILPDIKN